MWWLKDATEYTVETEFVTTEDDVRRQAVIQLLRTTDFDALPLDILLGNAWVAFPYRDTVPDYAWYIRKIQEEIDRRGLPVKKWMAKLPREEI